jgi:hypothetical protein
VIELLLEAERALSMGRVDRAEVLYQQVVASDPRNSIAVVGLARVALERADDAGALVLARRALAIDAQNVAAQRLVQRLEEVIQTRGEPLPAAEAPPAVEAAPAAADEPAPAADARQADVPQAADAPPLIEAPPLADGPPAAPVPAPRPTPFDGPDPVLGGPTPDVRATRSGTPDAPSAIRRRSLLDRLRGR